MSGSIWRVPIVHKDSIFYHVNNSMLEFTNNYKSALPDFNHSKTLMCFSDYSGEEEESKYSVYSFLIISDNNLNEWETARRKLRTEILADGRRVSFKNYRDKRSQKFITEYLKLADNLDGYLITISISKEINSLFENDAAINLSNPQFAKYSDWTQDTIEKTFRVMHLLGLFAAGLSTEYQNLLWITDNDKIAANNDRITQLTELSSFVSTGYLNHSLGHLRVGTTQSDDGSKFIEDLCSIPDLAAGAYSDQLKSMERGTALATDKIFWLYSPTFKKKTNDLTWWLTASNKNLCKLCFRIEKVENKAGGVSFYHFYNRD